MGLHVVACQPKPKGSLKLTFVGEFFTSTWKAEFNRQLAMALLDEGVILGILHRGPHDWYLKGEGEPFDLFEKLERDVPPAPDFYLCWEGENVGLSETPVFRLVAGDGVNGGDEYAFPVVALKPPEASWPEAARRVKERLEGLRNRPRRYEITSLSLEVCLFAPPKGSELAEKTRANLASYVGQEVMPRFLPPEKVDRADPKGRLLLMAEGEALLFEDREAFEEAFFSPEERIVLLEAIPLDGRGLKQFILPSLRFFRGRAIEGLTPLTEVPLFCQGRWAPVRVLRPIPLSARRRERMSNEGKRDLPPYHLHHLLAVDAAATGRWKEAITAFQIAYREAPEPYRALVLRNLALALIEQGRYQEALNILQDGQKLYRRYPDLGYLAGLVYWRQKNYAEAVQELLRAVEEGEANRWYYSDPGAGSYKSLFLVGEVYKEEDNLNGALAAYIGSLTHNSCFLPALERLAGMDLDQGVACEVSELLRQLLDLRQPEVARVFERCLTKSSCRL